MTAPHRHYWRLNRSTRAYADFDCRCGAQKREWPNGRLNIKNADGQTIYEGRVPQALATLRRYR